MSLAPSCSSKYSHPNRINGLCLAAIAVGLIIGAAPVLGQDRGVITEDSKLMASDAAARDEFGQAVAIHNGVVAVGVPKDDDNGPDSGSAYLFDASTGAQIAKLLPNDGSLQEWFGYSIANHNGVVAVGMPFDDDSGTNSGSAYLFDASTGLQTAKLLALGGVANDWFGYSIAINNGIVVVGAINTDHFRMDSGSAYVFNAATGTLMSILRPGDAGLGDQFGISVAIENGIVAVGAHHDDDNGTDSGSAYLFDASTGLQLAKLLPGDGSTADQFGFSIALSNGIVSVGAWGDDDTGNSSGAAYLFDASTGLQLAKLLPGDAASSDNFGYSTSISNGIVAVGAWHNNTNGFNSGSAYLFDASTGTQITKIIPSTGVANDLFGTSIALDSGTVVVGARETAISAADTTTGSAYLFTVPGAGCPVDINGDGAVDVLDFFAFITAFGNNDMIADLDGSGAIDVLDFFAFITLFAAGCP